LPQDLDKAAADVPLLNASNRLLASPLFQTDLAQVKPDPDVLIKNAKKVIALADGDGVLSTYDKAEAYGTAGLCYQDSARRPGIAVARQQAWRREGIRLLQIATARAPANPWSGTWHKAIGEQAIDLLKQDPKQHAEVYAIGREHLEKALKIFRGSSNERIVADLTQLQDDLSNLNPSK
jgi:hypothetical protein